MSHVQRFLSLLQMVNAIEDPERALDELTRSALEITESRNALLARLDGERGYLEISNGAGADWQDHQSPEKIRVGTRAGEGIVAYVAATGAPKISGDVSQEPLYSRLYESTRSEAAAPVRDRHGRIRAVMNVESDQPNHYNESKAIALYLIAELAAMVIEREAVTQRESALIEIGHALDRALTEEEVVKGVLRIAGEVLRFQAFAVFIQEAGTNRYLLHGAVGPLKSLVGQIEAVKGEGITGSVAQTGKPWLTHDPSRDPRWTSANNEFPDHEIASFLAVPVVFRGRCVAILRALRKVGENPHLDTRFTDDDVRVLTAIAEQMATALESIRAVKRLVHSERMAAWGELSAKSSHMIGNRVFALKGDVNELGHVLRDTTPSPKVLQELQESLARNVLYVEEILQDFRDFLTATTLATESADLNRLIEATVREFVSRQDLPRIIFNLSEDVPEVQVDTRRMRRAISELVENSFHYIGDDNLCVRTRLAEPGEVATGKLPATKSYVVIEVEDTGPGVPEDRKDTIFQPFFSGRVKGMGLGLSIVRGIVEAHGGAVYEAGLSGQGAKFMILLPAQDRS